MREVARKLGYTSNGNNHKTIQSRLDKYNISTKHFTGQARGTVKRTFENVFIENSTVTQAVLRRWYKKGNYTKYECAICGQQPEWNNKPLTLILDHINGNNHDDRLENLRWVCPNCNQQLDTTNGKNNLNKKRYNSKEENKCIDCGKKISRNAVRCNSCESKRRSSNNITREELKELIRNKPFTQIGEQYGISDNAIRKWCIKYNLPSKKKDIKKYSDDEWLLI